MNIKQRIAEINARLKQLRGSIATAKDDELDGIEKEMNELIAERATLQKRLNMQNAAQRAAMMESEEDEDEDSDEEDDEDEEENAPEVRTVAQQGQSRQQKRAAERKKEKEMRGAAWRKNNRTVILDSDILIPKKQSGTLVGMPFNEVSNILNVVNYLDVIKGESYEEPFVVETGMADYTDQPSADGTGGMYHEVGIDWDTVKINKTKITAYSEITKELEKTPDANYAGAVEGNVTVSLRKKLAKEIVLGDGEDGHFVGIFSDAVKPITVADYEIGEINENTLDELILNYGGEEDIESVMALLLNKLTLLAFSRVRGSDKRKVYNINYANSTIDGIKFYTTSGVKGFEAAGTGDAFLAYGDFNKYRVAVFSNIETARSTEYKFRQGITCFRGDVFMGGNIIGYKAFIRVFKGASSVKTLTKKTV